jgi:hypothetical protein
MKHAAGILIMVLLFIAGCKKDTATTTQLQHDLTGSWELSKAYVYTDVPGGVLSYQPGNGNTLLFGNNRQFTETVVSSDTSYTVNGTYLLQKEDNCGINLLSKRNNSNTTDNYHIAVHQDSLFVNSGNCIADAPVYIYLRKQ